MRIIACIFFLMLVNSSYSQILLEVSKSDSLYYKVEAFNDSISKIKIKPDTLSFYKVTKIKKKRDFYIIEAERKINETTYYYRIKSDKLKVKNCASKIKVGRTYQLDVRDYNNINQRLHFIPGIAFNMVTHMGSIDFNNSPFDIIEHWDEKLTEDDYNIALNLTGLCVREKSDCSSEN